MSRALKIIGILVLLLFIIPTFLSGYMPWMQAYGNLLIGWATFLPGRLSKATVNWSGVGMMLLCLALTVGFAHNFCGWLWRGTGHTEAWRPRWTLAGVAVTVLMFISGMAVTGLAHQVGWLLHSPEPLVHYDGGGNQRNASTSLKTIWSAQRDFRENDRDENGIPDFWRADIAGLYTTQYHGQPMKLIELSIAAADERPKSDLSRFAERSPKAGYWFRALSHASEKEPGPMRFAACAFPVNPSSGTFMFLVCEDGVLYRKPFDRNAPDVYPENPRAEGWTPLD